MITTPNLTSATDRTTKWLERGLLLNVILACLLAMSHHNADPDLWGHVQYGQDVLREGLPSTTTYSYTAKGYRWINHENLSELLMAAGLERIGPAGLLVVKNLLGLVLLVLIYWQATRRGVTQAPLYITMLLVACNLMHSWTLRPQLMTYILFGVMIALFNWCFEKWPNPWPALVRRGQWRNADTQQWAEERRRLGWLWLLPVIMVIWTNSHGGFVAGYCIMTAYLVGRAAEALVAYGRQAWSTVALLAGIVAAAALVTVINPYGLEMHQWLLGSLGSARPEITEWRPPEFLSLVWPTWWLMVALFLVALAVTRQPRDWTNVAILCLTLWQACEHRRHMAFFAILFGFWMPVHVQSLLLRFKRSRSQDIDPKMLSVRVRRGLLAALAIVTCVLSFNLFNHLRQIPVRRDSYPVTAFQYITDQNLSGNLIVRFKWAQYAIAAFGTPSSERPQLKVAFDGRFRTCYPQQLVDMYFDFAIGDAPPEMRYRSPLSPPADGSRILQYKYPDLVLIDREQTYAVQMMQEHRDAWTLMYQDSLAQLWGRSDKYDDPFGLDYVPPARRVIGDEPQTGSVPWPALPRRRDGDTACPSSSVCRVSFACPVPSETSGGGSGRVVDGVENVAR
jgi:hypothetical protein